jgi:hypothetical protein
MRFVHDASVPMHVLFRRTPTPPGAGVSALDLAGALRAVQPVVVVVVAASAATRSAMAPPPPKSPVVDFDRHHREEEERGIRVTHPRRENARDVAPISLSTTGILGGTSEVAWEFGEKARFISDFRGKNPREVSPRFTRRGIGRRPLLRRNVSRGLGAHRSWLRDGDPGDIFGQDAGKHA